MYFSLSFFFQAEDGIRDGHVTGVQTCALPICRAVRRAELVERSAAALSTLDGVGEFEFLGVEDICAKVDTATAVCEVDMALLADGSWAISIGIYHDDAKMTSPRVYQPYARTVED